MKTTTSSIQRRAWLGAHIAGAASLLLIASLGSVSAGKDGKGKPKPGDDDPPPTEATVAYHLTWLSGSEGSRIEIYDVNSAGLAVGSSRDANGNWHPFLAEEGGGMTQLNDLWQLPAEVAGGAIVGSDCQINEKNQVSGSIEDAQGNRFLFLADLDIDDPDPVFLDVLPASGGSYLRMNENGDLSFGFGTVYIYVRSMNQLFQFPNLDGHVPTSINDNLQITLNSFRTIEWTYNTYRFTFDDLDGGTGMLENLEANLGSNARSFVQDINNNGTVFGFSENRKATAGFVGDSFSWTRIDSALPSGNSGGGSLTVKASALSVNEADQILGGFNVLRVFAGTDLWLQDPDDGIFEINDLVTGDEADVQAFRSWQGFRNAVISEAEPVTGYGIIAGTLAEEEYSIQNTHGFILTPYLLQP